MSKIAPCGLALATFLIAGAAAAAPITYTYSVTGTGTVNGVAFTNQPISYVLKAGTTTTTDSDHDNVFSSGVITIAGTACAAGCTMTSPATYRFSTNILSSVIIGIESAAGGAPYVNEGLFPSSPSINAPVAAMTASNTNAYAPYTSVATSEGPIVVTTNRTNPTFSAALLAVTAVPTLSEWTMILMGAIFAGAGALYIQRRRLVA